MVTRIPPIRPALSRFAAFVSSPARRLSARQRLVTGAASLALLLMALVPALAVGAQSPYPANAAISSYFDPRYCGNGAVSVVTDSGGNLIDVCTSTGARVVPVYPDYPVAAAYTTPVYTNTYANTSAYAYTTVAGAYANASGYTNGIYGTRQYTDSRTNCPNGDVTQTGASYVCTANGAPAVVVTG